MLIYNLWCAWPFLCIFLKMRRPPWVQFLLRGSLCYSDVYIAEHMSHYPHECQWSLRHNLPFLFSCCSCSFSFYKFLSDSTILLVRLPLSVWLLLAHSSFVLHLSQFCCLCIPQFPFSYVYPVFALLCNSSFKFATPLFFSAQTSSTIL